MPPMIEAIVGSFPQGTMNFIIVIAAIGLMAYGAKGKMAGLLAKFRVKNPLKPAVATDDVMANLLESLPILAQQEHWPTFDLVKQAIQTEQSRPVPVVDPFAITEPKA